MKKTYSVLCVLDILFRIFDREKPCLKIISLKFPKYSRAKQSRKVRVFWLQDSSLFNIHSVDFKWHVLHNSIFMIINWIFMVDRANFQNIYEFVNIKRRILSLKWIPIIPSVEWKVIIHRYLLYVYKWKAMGIWRICINVLINTILWIIMKERAMQMVFDQ